VVHHQRDLVVEVPPVLTIKPFPYQDVAIDQGLERGNLLIAYGMGLGKTLVQLAICEELLGQNESTLNAIVVPSSLKWQWAQAIVWATDVQSRDLILKPRSKHPQKVTIPMRHQCVVIDGTPERRDQDYRYIREYRPDYVILGYENVVNDWRQIKRMHPDLIALDEATAIKSFGAERSLKVKEWNADYRFALTGTPIDNRPEELFSIMEWVDPTELGRFDLFDKAYISRDGYGRPKRYKNLDVLHTKTKTFVARKTRFDSDVAPFMPKDFHKDFYVTLVGKAKSLYQEVAVEMAEKLGEIVGMGGFDVAAYYSGEGSTHGDQAQGDAMARFNVLAMLCDHPQLVLDSAQKFETYVTSEEDDPVLQGSKYAFGLLEEGKLDWINKKTTSPKFEEVIEQILDVMDERPENKLILFSFTKKMLRLFRDRLAEHKIKSVIFDGDMGTTEKETAKQQFKSDPKTRVFLSSDAGGMGVDLPEANYLINYNHPWSAGKADQRNSRHIRAGSKWDEVWVLNFVVRGSVEDWKYQVLDLKRRVGSAILDGAPTQKGVIDFDVASLLAYVEESAL
jgi:SNF2 family DNA or RNA helicase